MTTATGTIGDDTFIGSAGDDTYNYGNVVIGPGSVVSTARGFDTISVGSGGFDILNLGTLSPPHLFRFRDGNDFVIQIQPTVNYDNANVQTQAIGGVRITNLYSPDGSGMLERIDFVGGYQLLSLSAGVLRLQPFGLGGGTNSLLGSAGNDTLIGLDVSANYLEGNAGNDTLIGNAGADELNGGAGDDILNGGDYSDKYYGGEGDDTLIAGGDSEATTADDQLDGGSGFDTADYRFADSAITVSLYDQYGTVIDGLSGQDRLTSIERVIGSAFNDLFQGDYRSNVFDGGAGNDRLEGNDGDDTLIGGDGNDELWGGTGDDILLGGAGAEVFGAGATASYAIGAGNDSIDGGAILDRVGYLDANSVDYRTAGTGITLFLGPDASVGRVTGTSNDGYGGTDTLVNINVVWGSSFADQLTGTTDLILETFIVGNGDVIDGGTITDTVNGFNSNRAELTVALSGVTVDLDTTDGVGITTAGAFARFTGGAGNGALNNINQLRGTQYADFLYGSGRIDVVETFEGATGDDTIDGRGGVDLVRYDYYHTLGVVVKLNAGTDGAGRVYGRSTRTGDNDTFYNIEGVGGSQLDDTLTGGNPDNDTLEIFIGNGGSDLINGGSGFDRVDYTSSMQGVVVTLGGASDGTATDGMPILFSKLQYPGTSGAVIGTDTLRSIEAVRGSQFDDTLTGSSVASEEVFEGRDGADLIDGQGGLDRASYASSPAAVTVMLGANATDGSAEDGWGSTDVLRNIENVEGSLDFGDYLVGNEGPNRLEGLGGDDQLEGKAGDDVLVGGGGYDYLGGGQGADVLDGTDGYSFADYNGASSGVSAYLTWEAGNSGEAAGDTYIAIEGLTGSAFADVLSGNAVENTVAGFSGNDWLFGREGQDELYGGTGNDVLSGGSGSTVNNYGGDLLDGGNGIDVAYYRDAPNTVFLISEVGNKLGMADGHSYGISIDIVDGANNFGEAMGDALVNIENIWGSRFDDIIRGDNAVGGQVYGFEGNDILDGRGGDDVFYGGTGADTLTGGAGAEDFFYLSYNDHYNQYGTLEANEGGDTITDFEHGVDHITVSRYWFGFGNIAGPAASLTTQHADFITQGSTAMSAKPTFFWSAATGALQFDADGTGATGAVNIATLTNGTALTLDDIWTA